MLTFSFTGDVLQQKDCRGWFALIKIGIDSTSNVVTVEIWRQWDLLRQLLWIFSAFGKFAELRDGSRCKISVRFARSNSHLAGVCRR